MSVIQIEGLQKEYNGNLVLKGLNLTIHKGEVYGFIGMNGAGKTTTINLIMSLIHKTSGSIKINNEEVDFSNQKYKQQIGFVPDVPSFPRHMNACEYLQYTQELFGIKVDNVKIKEVLSFVSLDNENKRIHTFSRGMKQRLAIAQALIHDPEILIMDEPMSALDPVGRGNVIEILNMLKGNKTIFYSTHILDDIEKVCDRVGILHNGELVLEDDIKNLKDKFLSNDYSIKSVDNEKLITQLNSVIFETFELKKDYVFIKLKSNYNGKDLLKELCKIDVDYQEIKQITKSIQDIFIEETK